MPTLPLPLLLLLMLLLLMLLLLSSLCTLLRSQRSSIRRSLGLRMAPSGTAGERGRHRRFLRRYHHGLLVARLGTSASRLQSHVHVGGGIGWSS